MVVHERGARYALEEERYFILERPVTAASLGALAPGLSLDVPVSALQYRFSSAGDAPYASLRAYGPSVLYAGASHLSLEDLRMLFVDRAPILEGRAGDAHGLDRVVERILGALRGS